MMLSRIGLMLALALVLVIVGQAVSEATLELHSNERVTLLKGNPHPVQANGDVERSILLTDRTQESNVEELLQQLPSLRGATLPNGLRVDGNGDLITDLQLKLLFDVLLAASVDANPDQLTALLQALARPLPLSAAQDVMQWWIRYSGYQVALRDLAMTKPVAADLSAQHERQWVTVAELLEQRQQLQQEWLGEQASAWFEADNAYDQEMLARARQGGERDTQQKTPAIQTLPRQAEYETRRDQLLAQGALAPEDQVHLLDQLRTEFYPRRQDFIRQSLRDLSMNDAH